MQFRNYKSSRPTNLAMLLFTIGASVINIINIVVDNRNTRIGIIGACNVLIFISLLFSKKVDGDQSESSDPFDPIAQSAIAAEQQIIQALQVPTVVTDPNMTLPPLVSIEPQKC